MNPAVRFLIPIRVMAAVSLVAAALAADASRATGPLRVHPQNPRYFTDGTRATDGSLRVVYLTGSHTWNSLVDMTRDESPGPFDFDAYLGFLADHHHNFIRLWAWDSTTWDSRANVREGNALLFRVAPLPWARTGPGVALDGQPKFDLTKFDGEYFTRLRARVEAAGRRGIYVSVMLFEGWGMYHANRRKGTEVGWAWRTHPLHPDNNINGIDGGGDTPEGGPHRLGREAANQVQAAYLRQVVDTVNDLDHVLYEVINEGGDKSWNAWVARTVRDYERTKPRQHPIGLTGHGADDLASMLAGATNWCSPGRKDGYAEEPPAWEQAIPSLLDTDHIWGVGGNADWAWKSFFRGHNPIFMDPYDHRVLGKGKPEQWIPLRRALGQTRRLAERLPLALMPPRDSLASTGYCLAQPGVAYAAYLPKGGGVTLDLDGALGRFAVEWIHPIEGTVTSGESVAGGAETRFTCPFAGASVLVLRRQP